MLHRLMMQVPRTAATFDAYIGIVTSAIRQAMGSAAVVVVVFDDPKFMTAAKREEQMKRDAQRTKTKPVCSEDITPFPQDDDYGPAELHSAPNCHDIVGCRAARQRFFDETGRMMLEKLKQNITRWAEGGNESVVIFDGLDPRGANRPVGEPRTTAIFGSNDSVAALFEREEPMGEGDLKLAWVEQRVRDLTESGKLKATLHATVTIDTDSIAIELLEQARRNCLPDPTNDVKGVLCMRERAQKRDEWEGDSSAVYWCVDYGHLLRLLQEDMWGVKRSPTPIEQRAAMSLMAAGWALAGCDFVKVAGLNAALVMEAIPGYLKTAPELLDLMHNSWSGDRLSTQQLAPALRRLLLLCATNYGEMPRARKASVTSMREHAHEDLLRASWVIAYWNQCEFTDNLRDFGFSACLQSSGPAVPSSADAAVSKKRKSPMLVEEPAEQPTGDEAGPPSVVSRFFASAARPQDRVEGAPDLSSFAFGA